MAVGRLNQMLCLDDAALARLITAARPIPAPERGRWLEALAERLEAPSPSLSPGARRMRAYRARKLHQGRGYLRIEADIVGVEEMLRGARLLAPHEDSRLALERALQDFITTLVLDHQRHAT